MPATRETLPADWSLFENNVLCHLIAEELDTQVVSVFVFPNRSKVPVVHQHQFCFSYRRYRSDKRPEISF